MTLVCPYTYGAAVVRLLVFGRIFRTLSVLCILIMAPSDIGREATSLKAIKQVMLLLEILELRFPFRNLPLVLES